MPTVIVTTLAMIAFAANSILCRLALGQFEIDAASFTSIRLISGAITLTFLLSLKQPGALKWNMNISSSLALFCYAICFSFAYLELTTGTGALILFGTIQLAMIIYGVISGEKPTFLMWLGIVLASGGLVYLMLPGVGAPSITGATLMALAGLAWSVYTIRGKSTKNAVAATTWNFIGTIPFTVIASIVFVTEFHATSSGIILAIASGALASGVGYVLWYAALPQMSITIAAIAQITVPVIAAFGGVLFMSEMFSLRLVVASFTILGGIALVIFAKRPKR